MNDFDGKVNTKNLSPQNNFVEILHLHIKYFEIHW